MSVKPIPQGTLRYAAKAVIIKDRKILSLKKKGDIGTFYVLPGGGQNFQEQLNETVVRECREELGVEIEVGDVIHIQEYIGSRHQFRHLHGQMHFVNIYFRCFIKAEKMIPPSSPDQGQIKPEWLPIEDLDKYVFYPSGLLKCLHNPGQSGIYLGESV